MIGEDGTGPKSALTVAAEIVVLILVPPVVFGLAVALIAGPEHAVGGALIGGVVGVTLARMRRELYGAVGR